MQDGDVKVYNAPSAPTYLVQQADSHNFLIHREISKAECDLLESREVFEREGKWFRFLILNAENLDKAESAIHGFFRAHHSLKQWAE